MANNPELADPAATFQSAVWRHSGFPVDVKEETHIICCLWEGPATLLTCKCICVAVSKKPQQQQILHEAFKMKPPPNKDITNAMGVFMAFYTSDWNISAVSTLVSVQHDTDTLHNP